MAQSNGTASQGSSRTSLNGHQSVKSSPSSQSTAAKEEMTRMLQKLCYVMNNKNNDEVFQEMYSFAYKFTNNQIRAKLKDGTKDEQYYVDKIRRYLIENASSEEVEVFDNNIRQNRELNVLKQPQRILHLLYLLANSDGSTQSQLQDFESESRESLSTIPAPPKSFSKSSSKLASLESPTLSQRTSVTLPSSVINANVGLDNRPQKEQNKGSIPWNRKIKISENTISESQLVQDLLYIFQGVNGQYIKYNPIVEGYNIDSKACCPRRLRVAALRLAELGWMHSQVRKQCDDWAANKSVSTVLQALAAALREQLTEYYRLVANLQVQISSGSGDMLLRDVSAWTDDSRRRFMWLATATRETRGRRGGAAVSAVHALMQHGDPFARSVNMHLLAAVCKPVFRMLSRWMLDGELDDPHGEFFISANNAVRGDHLWHEKYSVQKSMVPSFISMSQADKVLATGKSINFLRETCNDTVELRCRDALSEGLEPESVEALILSDRVVELTSLMNAAYLETSRRVIDVLNEKFSFLQHLRALREFMLLGQGDFIRYLMELLEPELCRPAEEVFSHHLSSLLDSAVRASNAQYAAPDTLRRLDVRLLEATSGDTGWDVFTLDYHTLGPIGTVFAPTTTSYLLLFQSLWKAKRIEYVLSQMWKQQISASKMLNKIPELSTVLQQTHLLTHEMVLAVHRLQYYVTFEVVECSSQELATSIAEAESLDDIVRMHREFVDTIRIGALVDSSCNELSIQLRAVFTTVLQLKAQVDQLHACAHEELAARARHKEEIKASEVRGEWGIDQAREEAYTRATRHFLHKFLPNARIQLKTLAKSYQNCVWKLIRMFAGSGNSSLQLLSVRLDFNDHYSRADRKAVK